MRFIEIFPVQNTFQGASIFIIASFTTWSFARLAIGKAAPYGVYDVAANEAFVNGGQSPATAEFAVASMQGWWDELGPVRYPEATNLYIISDSGGSHSAVSRLDKVQLQAWADATGLEIPVRHYPPGTSQ